MQKATKDKRLFIKAVDMHDKEKLLNALKESLGSMCGGYLFFAAEKTQSARAREFIRLASVSIGTAKVAPYWTRNLYSKLQFN